MTSLSELAAFAGENPDRSTLCAAAEFLTRDDGLPGLEETYGFEFSDVAELELGLVYPRSTRPSRATSARSSRPTAGSPRWT